MFGVNWRYILAALGIAALALGYAGYEQLQHVDHQPYTNYKYQPARDRLALPAKDPRVATKPYQPYCDQPQNGNDADLCAQWASVTAVEEGNRLSRTNILITGLEFAALIISLFFTGWAALAASKAARMAEEATKDADAALAIAERNAEAAANQVKVSEATAHRQLRPYVYLTNIRMAVQHMGSIDYVSDDAQLVLHFNNFGQTPAKHVKFRVKTFLGGIWNEPFDVDLCDCPIIHMGDMPPNFVKERDGFTVLGLKEMHENLLFGTASIFVSGEIEYEGGTGGPYKTSFRLASTSDDYKNTKFSVTPLGNESD